MKYDVLALGEILIDFVPGKADTSGDKAFVRKAGGAPLNLLATVAKFGGKTAFCGKVGDDMFGAFLRRTVKDAGIDDSCISVDKVHNTTLAFVSLDDSGDRDFSFYRNFGADTFLTTEDIPEEAIRSSRFFHFGSLSFTQEPSRSAAAKALKTAREAGCIITYDPNYRPPLWEKEETAVKWMRDNIEKAHISKLSLEEALMIAGTNDADKAAGILLSMGPSLLLITDGPNDVRYCARDFRGTVPALDVKSLDTTGAGDIFFGTFLSCLISSGLDPKLLDKSATEEFVRKAVYVSGMSTLKSGAIASIPDHME